MGTSANLMAQQPVTQAKNASDSLLVSKQLSTRALWLMFDAEKKTEPLTIRNLFSIPSSGINRSLRSKISEGHYLMRKDGDEYPLNTLEIQSPDRYPRMEQLNGVWLHGNHDLWFSKEAGLFFETHSLGPKKQ